MRFVFWIALCVGCNEYDLNAGLNGPSLPVDTTEPGLTGPPDIAVTPPLLQFGTVDVGNPVERTFSVANEGGEPLVVSDLFVSAGFSHGYQLDDLAPLPWTLNPGSLRDVTVTFDPTHSADAPGEVLVLSNDPDEAEVPVALANQVRLPCNDDYSDTMPWRKSPIWYDAAAPTDLAGLDWLEPAFDDGAWDLLGGLPDEDWSTEDHDVFYRATFWLDEVVGKTDIEFVGNDGVWLYVNGAFVGHWGGEWRAGGCINEPVNCGLNYDAPPVDVTSFLHAGENVVAVMLTNGPTGYYLEINATCVEG